MSGRISISFIDFIEFSFVFVALRSGYFWCETGAVLKKVESSTKWPGLAPADSNLGVGRSNRSGRTSLVKHLQDHTV
jgi:hypothetical protein